MLYDTDKRVFIVNNFAIHKNTTLVQRAFRTKYHTSKAPAANTINNMVSNFQNTGSVCRKRVLNKKRTVRTEDLIESIKNLYLADDKTSLRKMANLVPASISTIRNVAREDLNLKPFKQPHSFKLYKADYQKRLDFVDFVASRRLNVEKWLIVSDEAYFYLHGGQNIQNNRIWAEFQPTEVVEKPLNDEKIMVWCAFSANRFYGPYFFEENVNGENYLAMLKKFFWVKHCHVQNYQNYYFQQDGAPPHRTNEVQSWLESKFGERFINKSQWPPRSPDLNPCDFSLWGTLKSRVYNPRPTNLQQLKENVEREIEIFKKSNLFSIFSNLKKRLSLIKQENGRHIEHKIK